jgi:hypothetical protein
MLKVDHNNVVRTIIFTALRGIAAYLGAFYLAGNYFVKKRKSFWTFSEATWRIFLSNFRVFSFWREELWSRFWLSLTRSPLRNFRILLLTNSFSHPASPSSITPYSIIITFSLPKNIQLEPLLLRKLPTHQDWHLNSLWLIRTRFNCSILAGFDHEEKKTCKVKL